MSQRQVLIITHHYRATAQEAFTRARDLFASNGIEAHDDESRVGECELVFVLGGDGTILAAAELTKNLNIPILGLNFGHIGFLAEIEQDQLAQAVQRIAEGTYDVEWRNTVGATIYSPDGEVSTAWALNEIALQKQNAARGIEIILEIDERPLTSFACDGLIVSTATGSTAHAFSAGGPIIWPELDTVLVTPVAAHALFAKPLVLGSQSKVAIEVMNRSSTNGHLTCDGRRQQDLVLGTRIEYYLGQDRVGLVRLTDETFTDKLVHKFSLPVSGWRGRPSQ